MKISVVILGAGNSKRMGIGETDRIQHKLLSKAIESAQKKIEGNNYGIRKNLLEYDQVMNDQREIIYNERRKVLDGENMRDTIIAMLNATVDKIVSLVISVSGFVITVSILLAAGVKVYEYCLILLPSFL